MKAKVTNLESMVSDHCTKVRTSFFDINLASQMMLTKLPLIHIVG